MANGPAPQYPVMPGPSLQSVIGRQRMGIEDAMYAAERQRERQTDLLGKGAKGAYEYDKMLRGFMEAKYANPELTFWDYVSKPSVGAAFRKQGRDLIAEQTLAGEKIEGMGIGARHKSGLRGVLGMDKPATEETAREIAGMTGGKSGTREQILRRELSRISDIGEDVAGVKKTVLGRESLKTMKNRAVGEAYLQSEPNVEPFVWGEGDYWEDPSLRAMKEKLTSGTSKLREQSGLAVETIENIEQLTGARVKYEMPGAKLKKLFSKGKVQIPGDPGYQSPEELLASRLGKKIGGPSKPKVEPGLSALELRKAREAYVMPRESLKGILGKGKVLIPTDPGYKFPETKLIEEFGTEVPQEKFIYNAKSDLTYAQQRAVWKTGGLQKGVDVVPGATEAVGTETAKGGLKATLGKAAGTVASGLALGGGLYTAARGETAQQRTGGAITAAGGAAGLVAATNFWNPVGWAAAIPLALGVLGGGVTATGGKKRRGTPLDRYRRRIGII